MTEQDANNTNTENELIVAAALSNREKFLILLEHEAFSVESGQITINVNNGQFQNVFINQMVYKKSNNSNPIPI